MQIGGEGGLLEVVWGGLCACFSLRRFWELAWGGFDPQVCCLGLSDGRNTKWT